MHCKGGLTITNDTMGLFDENFIKALVKNLDAIQGVAAVGVEAKAILKHLSAAKMNEQVMECSPCVVDRLIEVVNLNHGVALTIVHQVNGGLEVAVVSGVHGRTSCDVVFLWYLNKPIVNAPSYNNLGHLATGLFFQVGGEDVEENLGQFVAVVVVIHGGEVPIKQADGELVRALLNHEVVKLTVCLRLEVSARTNHVLCDQSDDFAGDDGAVVHSDVPPKNKII